MLCFVGIYFCGNRGCALWNVGHLKTEVLIHLSYQLTDFVKDMLCSLYYISLSNVYPCIVSTLMALDTFSIDYFVVKT